MKLSKQERIGALIILAIVILALGAFLLVKPKFEEAIRTKETLSQRQDELDRALERQKLKPDLRTNIEKEYAEGEHLADMFFPELSSYGVDNAFRDFLKQLDIPVVVQEIEVEEPSTEELNVSFYTPTAVEYALKTYVTQGIEPSDEENRIAQRRQTVMSALSQSQTIGATKLNFTVSALNVDDLYKFIDAVNDYRIEEEGSNEKVRKAVSIAGFTYEYENEVNQFYNIAFEASKVELSNAGREALRGMGIKPSSEDEEPPQAPEEILVSCPVSLSTTITFLSVERMQDPKPQLDIQDGKAPSDQSAG